jgi:hypothetical protein
MPTTCGIFNWADEEDEIFGTDGRKKNENKFNECCVCNEPKV